MRIPKKLVLISVLFLASATAFTQQKDYRVVATTSWTAALAMADRGHGHRRAGAVRTSTSG